MQFKEYIKNVIELHKLFRNNRGDSLRADNIRDSLCGMDKDGDLTDNERILINGLVGDLYMISDESLYRKTIPNEIAELIDRLYMAMRYKNWTNALDILRYDLDLPEYLIAHSRYLCWKNIDKRVALIFLKYSKILELK